VELTFNLTALNTANNKGIENATVLLLETGTTTFEVTATMVAI
jgi:hypothetical protein